MKTTEDMVKACGCILFIGLVMLTVYLLTQSEIPYQNYLTQFIEYLTN